MTTQKNSAEQVKTFFGLLAEGKQAALDVCLDTGDVVCRASVSVDKRVGNGTPGILYSAVWTRIASCEKFGLI